jgi:hypothetical protein
VFADYPACCSETGDKGTLAQDTGYLLSPLRAPMETLRTFSWEPFKRRRNLGRRESWRRVTFAGGRKDVSAKKLTAGFVRNLRWAASNYLR